MPAAASKIHSKPSLTMRIYARLVLLDYLRFGLVSVGTRALRKGRRVLILDRYYPDVVYAVSREFGLSAAATNRWARIFRKMLPSPSVTLALRAPPAILFARKPAEFGTPRVAEDKVRDYEAVLAFARQSLVPLEEIDASSTLEASKDQAWKLFTSHCNLET